MEAILSIVQVLIAIAMIAIILIQRGPGAAAGSGFGAGASGTVFGARGAGSFMTRATAFLAAGFLIVSMTMAVIASRTVQPTTEVDLGVMGSAQPEAVSEVPAIALPEATDEVPEFEVPAADDEVPPAAESEEEGSP